VSADRERTRAEFRDAVNMTGTELEDWLATDESRSVGVGGDGDRKTGTGGGESVGHESGRRIVDDGELLHPSTVSPTIFLVKGSFVAGGRGYEDDVTERFRKGDRVTWSSHGGTAEGVVEEEITSDTEAAGRTVRASEDDPQYRVRSEKSGGEAVHKPSALKRK